MTGTARTQPAECSLRSQANALFESREVRNAEGEVVNSWNGQGGWSSTDTTITKTYYYPWDDNGQPVTGTIEKSYFFMDANTLFVHCWGCDYLDRGYDRLTARRRSNSRPRRHVGGLSRGLELSRQRRRRPADLHHQLASSGRRQHHKPPRGRSTPSTTSSISPTPWKTENHGGTAWRGSE